MKIDFIDFFERSVYRNIYIYNLIDYFLRHIYLHPTSDTYINNIILSFNYYLQVNTKLYIVYIDASLFFTIKKLYKYF